MAGRPVKDGELTVWTRKLNDGTVAVVLYNEDDAVTQIGFDAATIGLEADQPFTVRDLWQHKDLGVFAGTFSKIAVQPHEAIALRVAIR